MMLILQVVWLICIFCANISLTLTKIKFTIHKDRGSEDTLLIFSRETAYANKSFSLD
jgi:hypothetical protein